MINRVILVGNPTRDTEAVATNGKAMTRMRLATDSRWMDEEGNKQQSTEYHAFVAFGRLAEVTAQYCRRAAASTSKAGSAPTSTRAATVSPVGDRDRRGDGQLLDSRSTGDGETIAVPETADAGRAQG